MNLNAMNFKVVLFIGQFQKRGFRGYVKVTYLLTGSAERMGNQGALRGMQARQQTMGQGLGLDVQDESNRLNQLGCWNPI